MAERRRAGGHLIKRDKLTQAQIAQQLGVSRTAVAHWAALMKNGGLRALQQRVSSGRPRKLSRAQERDLIRCLKQGALAAGFATDRWTLARIQQLLKRQFQVDYHPNYLNRLLDQLGWSPQVPQAFAMERDDELIQDWLDHDWPRIKKKRDAMALK